MTSIQFHNYTKILEVNMVAFAYRLFHEEWRENSMKQSLSECKQINC